MSKNPATPSPPANYPRMLTIRQIASLKILPESALRRLVREQAIRGTVQIGRKTLINLDSLIAQLSGLTMEGGETEND